MRWRPPAGTPPGPGPAAGLTMCPDGENTPTKSVLLQAFPYPPPASAGPPGRFLRPHRQVPIPARCPVRPGPPPGNTRRFGQFPPPCRETGPGRPAAPPQSPWRFSFRRTRPGSEPAPLQNRKDFPSAPYVDIDPHCPGLCRRSSFGSAGHWPGANGIYPQWRWPPARPPAAPVPGDPSWGFRS